MLEELQAFALLGLIGTHYFLVRSCFGIKEELPIQGRAITDRLEQTSDLLDEVAQLIADLGDATSQKPPEAGSNSPFGIILNSLLNSNGMAGKHATPEQEWEVLPPDDDQTPTQEDN